MKRGFDVIVLGLGGMGSAAAYHLAARGKRVLGLERFGPAHDQGSSHGDSRIIRLAYHEHPSYVPLARRAYELWNRLERDSGTSILKETGGLMIGPPGSAVVEGAIRSATQHGLRHQILNAKAMSQRYPALQPRPDDIGLYESVAGYLRPELAIQAHLRLAAQLRAELHFEEPAIEWSAALSDDRVEVKTAQATYEASSLVIAAGAWAPEVISDLGIELQVQRRVMCWFHPQSEIDLPIYIWDVDGRICFYGMPATGSASDGVKAALHSGDQPCTVANVDRTIHDSDISEVRACLARFIPALNGPLARAACCMYTMSADQHFIVGLHPKYRQVALAAGFSGHGFKFTSVMGEILAELATTGKTNQPISFLSPARFSLHQAGC